MTATVYAVANQKGGVGKTTTTLNLAAAMAELGRAVLVVDLDPQGCLTFSLGYDPDTARAVAQRHGRRSGQPGRDDHPAREVDVVPANIDLAGAEVTLLSRTGREYLLRGELVDLLDSYDASCRLCAVPRGADDQRAHGRRRGPDPRAVRDPVAPRRVAAAGDGRRRARLTNRGLEVRG
jgi:chromosome partitioning protein